MCGFLLFGFAVVLKISFTTNNNNLVVYYLRLFFLNLRVKDGVRAYGYIFVI